MPATASPARPTWTTPKLGLVVSTMAAIVAMVLEATTAMTGQTIVLGVMVVAFFVSLQVTARRPLTR